jgi:hypothetical protein
MNRKANWIWVVHANGREFRANCGILIPALFKNSCRPTRPTPLFSRRILVLLIRWCCRNARRDDLVAPLPILMFMPRNELFRINCWLTATARLARPTGDSLLEKDTSVINSVVLSQRQTRRPRRTAPASRIYAIFTSLRFFSFRDVARLERLSAVRHT